MSGPINLTSRPLFHIANSEALGAPHPWHFSSPGNRTPSTMWKKTLKKVLFQFSAPLADRIFSISQVDFARLIKSSSLMSCLTSPPSLLQGAYNPAGATSQTDCCPAGMGLVAHQGPEAHSPWAFVWIWSVELVGVKQGERIEVILSSSGLLLDERILSKPLNTVDHQPPSEPLFTHHTPAGRSAKRTPPP